MEIRNLYAFLQVASTQSFTRAGQVLGYSQSNISMQIQQLEREVGAPLFDRIGRRVTLTQYGQELLPYAQRIVSTAVEMENLTRSERTLEGMLRVGMVESLFEMLFQPAVVRYHQRFPRVRVELTVDGTATLQEQLRQGQLDAACLIDGPLPQGQWNLWQVRQAAIVVVANPRHRLAGWAQVPLEELTGEEFILMESSAPYSAGFQRAMAAKGLPVEPFLQLQSAEMALRLVQEGPFLSVLPDYAVRRAMEEGLVRVLPIPDLQLVQQVQMVLWRTKVVTPQIQGFLEELRQALEELPG